MHTNRFLTFRLRKAALSLLLLWLVVSAFYYIQQLFSPNFYMGYDEGTLHKVLKYFACFTLSVYFCFAARAWGLIFFSGLLLLFAGFFVAYSARMEIATVSFLVTGTMLPFMLIPSLWEDRLLLIGRIIVLCGAVVGLFSVIELTLLSSLFAPAWASTGSIRSISTLFNPNNLGLYVGAALVLLPYMRLKRIWTALCAALLLFSLAASGSRTAWVSLFIVLIYAIIVSANDRARLLKLASRRLPQLLLFGGILVGIYVIYPVDSVSTEIEVTNRGADLYTASIRLENFLNFLSSIDGSILLPDISSVRSDYIQDNFYLVVLNSFGALGVILILIFMVTHFSPLRKSNIELFPWKLVFVFYMVSGLSGSQLNSFPNNQMFFLSMGALWVYRLNFGSACAGKAGIAPSVAKVN